jgi:uncharacterized protein (TIGR00299 family) protein
MAAAKSWRPILIVAYFDCFAGASGDMILGALLDVGLPLEQLSAELDKLGLPEFRLSADRLVKQGFAATQFQVLSTRTDRPVDDEPDDAHGHEHEHEHAHDHPHPHEKGHSHEAGGPGEGLFESGEGEPAGHGSHRSLTEIRSIIETSVLADGPKRRAIEVFTRLAEAEAAAHGIDIDAVHFHEVGAIDAIVDIVGACVAVELLGIDRIVVSPLPPGSGFVRCVHGLLPVPAPATLELLKGVPLAANPNPGELVTPTGAAILTTLVDEYANAIPGGLKVVAVGLGAGRREGANVPNVLRVVLAEPVDAPADKQSADSVIVMETNLDDIDGVAIGHCFGLLLDAGALDVWATPITMKKNRPAYMLSVLVEPDSPPEQACREILFSQTSTFGIRQTRMDRTKLARTQTVVQTPYGPIRVKVGRLGDQVLQSQPEYEDCREAARRTNQSLTEIRRAALAVFRETQ